MTTIDPTPEQLWAHITQQPMQTVSAEQAVAMQYLGLTDAMGYEASEQLLSPEEFAAALREDAERYRKVRRGQHWSVVNGIGDVLRGDELDAAVDGVDAVRAVGDA